MVVAYKSLLRKDFARSYRTDPAVRRPHEYAQSPVAESRMLSASSDQPCCHFPSLLVGGGIQRESPSNLTNGQEPGKTFQRKMFHVLTVFFRLVRRFLLDPVIRAIGFSTSATF